MNALYEAKQRVQDAYYDERGMADVMRQDAAIYAAIAQAEAARPRFVRIGDRIINIAHIAYVEFNDSNYDGQRVIKVYFSAVASEASIELWFGRHQLDAAECVLRQALEPLMVAETDLPEESPAQEPTP